MIHLIHRVQDFELFLDLFYEDLEKRDLNLSDIKKIAVNYIKNKSYLGYNVGLSNTFILTYPLMYFSTLLSLCVYVKLTIYKYYGYISKNLPKLT